MADTLHALLVVTAGLSPSRQEQVLDFARFLSQQEGAAPRPRQFYICPVCFQVALTPTVCHEHMMIPCNAENPEDCKLAQDTPGHPQTRAPRWFSRAKRRITG